MKKQIIAIDGRMWGSQFTGIGNYIQEVSTRMFALRPKIKFILFTTEKTAQKLSLPKNVEVIFANEPIYSYGEQISFRKKVRAIKADIFWFPHFNVPLFLRRPFVSTVHDLTIVKYPGKKMSTFWHRIAYFAVLRHTLRAAKKLISVSKYTKKEIKIFSKINPKKVHVVHNGIDVKRFGTSDEKKVKAFRKKYGTYFLISGVWREHKNIPMAIKAFEMYRKYGGKGSLVITGKPDPFYPEVQDLAEASEFMKDIYLTGFVAEKDMSSLFAGAHAFVFPSLAEGFGLPTLEAMAAKTPVLSSEASCLPEVCGDAALYFNPEDAEDIALKMAEVLGEKLQKKLVEKGLQRITEFSWDDAAKKTLSILEKA